KLRGFIADHSAEVSSNDGERIVLTIDDERVLQARRRSDRPVCFDVELHLNEEPTETVTGKSGSRVLRTRIFVKIRPKRNRDRRAANMGERARDIMASIKSYLMAVEDTPPVEDGLRRRAGEAIAP